MMADNNTPTPSAMVKPTTQFGKVHDIGRSKRYAREDHDHGAPALTAEVLAPFLPDMGVLGMTGPVIPGQDGQDGEDGVSIPVQVIQSGQRIVEFIDAGVTPSISINGQNISYREFVKTDSSATPVHIVDILGATFMGESFYEIIGQRESVSLAYDIILNDWIVM